jgi:uncharacterized protein (DUF58 family)
MPVIETTHDLLTRYGPQLVPMTTFLIVAGCLPLLVLALAKRIFPHTPLLVLLGLPCLLTFALLFAPWQPVLLPVILLIDVVIPAVALVDLLTLAGKRSFAIERETTRVASIQKNHRVTLHVSNISRLWRHAWIRDDVPQEFEAHPKEFVLRLGPRSRTTVHYDLKASRRGAFGLQKVYVRVRSFLGLWRRFLDYPVNSVIHVYPDMKQIAEYAILARTNRLSLMGVRRTRKVGTENDFERLRDYTLDDNYKYIDWRATARRSKLTVKDFQTSQSQRIIFLLDCGRLMTNVSSGISLLDHSLNAALMLSYVALRQGDSVGMVCFADRVLSFVPPRGGMNQMNRLLHASFDRFPELVESRYDDAFLYLATHVRKRSLVVLISNVIDEVNSHQIQSYLGNLVGRHLPLGVLLRDRHLFAAADTPPQTEDDLFRAAAAAEILTWRHQVLRDLEHQGVLVMDLFPEDMTAPLVNKYLEIKARHLL